MAFFDKYLSHSIFFSNFVTNNWKMSPNLGMMGHKIHYAHVLHYIIRDYHIKFLLKIQYILLHLITYQKTTNLVGFIDEY